MLPPNESAERREGRRPRDVSCAGNPSLFVFGGLSERALKQCRITLKHTATAKRTRVLTRHNENTKQMVTPHDTACTEFRPGRDSIWRRRCGCGGLQTQRFEAETLAVVDLGSAISGRAVPRRVRREARCHAHARRKAVVSVHARRKAVVSVCTARWKIEIDRPPGQFLP